MRGAQERLQAVETLESRMLLSAGDLDSAFAGGIAVKDILGGGDFGFAVAVQSDGKVLVAGRAYGGATGNDVAVVRFNKDGTLDTSFGGSGYVLTDLGSGSDGAYALAVQPDGKIVVAGETTRSGTLSDFAVVRYNSNGSLDSTFGTSGIVTVDVGGGTDQASALAITGSGQILVAGWASVGGLPRFALARLTSSGQLDSTFGSALSGRVTTAYSGGYARGSSVALLPNGEILVAGGAYSMSQDQTHFAVAKYSANGVLDSSFGSEGWAILNLGADQETANSIAVQADGKIVLAGQHDDSNTGQSDFAVARLLSSGAADSAFGTGGYTLTDFDSDYDLATSLALQSDGKIVVSGPAWTGGQSSFGIARYDANGALDTSFAGGKVAYASGVDAVGNAATIDASGNIVVGGFQSSDYSNYDLAVVRVIGRVNVAPTANPGGPYSVAADGSVRMDGTGSSDSDGHITSYEWDFDYDGTTFDADAAGSTVTFSAVGLSNLTRTVALRVTDDSGASTIATTTLTVEALPPAPPPPPTPTPTPQAIELVDDPRASGRKMLVVSGTSRHDCITFVQVRKNLIEVRMNGKKLGRYSDISRVIAYGNDGNDTIRSRDLSVPSELYGGRGNDLLVGTRFSDILVGGDGNDHLFGCKGDDLIVGGLGSDRLHSVWGNDILISGAMTVETDQDALRTILSQWTLRGPNPLNNLIVEDNAKDIVYGTPGPDWIIVGKKDKVVSLHSR